MLSLPLQRKNDCDVMSSVDLALLCVGDAKNSHSDFMKKAKKVIGEGVGKFSDTYLSSQGKSLACLMLPEREACLMAMSYSYELQARVYDAWQEVKKSKAASLPDFSDPVSAARAWADALEQKQIAQQQLAIAAPKADVFDKVMERETLLNATQVAQQVGMSAIAMNKKLDALGGVYNQCVKRGRVFCHDWILSGNGEMKMTEQGYPQSLFTAKGSMRVVEMFVSEGVV